MKARAAAWLIYLTGCVANPYSLGSDDPGVSMQGGAGGVAGSNGTSDCEAACVGPGRRCEAGVCTIDCNVGECADAVTCPSGIPCSVMCTVDACQGGVDCGTASDCTVVCTGERACAEIVDCSRAGRCHLTCSGVDSCRGAVNCGGATCDATCDGTSACSAGVCCTADTCNVDQRVTCP